MNRTLGIASLALALALLASALPAAPAESQPSALSFDYFQNSWNVIGLKDYNDGTRVTPMNELLLSGHRKLRIAIGPARVPLSRNQTKTLMDGWLPVILLHTEQDGVRYELTLWASPLPTVKDWKAAYAWPTEGENFLNWVRVRAVNAKSDKAQAEVTFDLVSTNRSTQLSKWSTSLSPHGSSETVFRIPFAPVADPKPLDTAKASTWLNRTVDFWRDLVDHAATIEVPCVKSTQALRAAHVCQFIANDHGVLKGGEGFYDEFYIRDGAYQVLELEEAGLTEAARLALGSYLKAQRPDGRFESQSNQYDANGQAVWTIWQFWKITGDTAWLRGVYPQMLRAVEWTMKARRTTPEPFTGLLPVAPADGEFLWDGKHHIVGYDIWNLRGMLCTAEAAEALGLRADAERVRAEAADYRKAIDAACVRTGLPYFPPSWEKAGTHWGNTETLWPTELFDQADPRVTALQEEVRQRHGGGFLQGTIRWTGLPDVIHPYMSSYTTMNSLVRGEHDRFVEEYYWYLLHTSASHAFPEGIFFKRRYAWSETIPHVTGAANFAFLLRHALIHERGGELHLLAGTPDEWLAPGQEIRVRNAPTHFGPVNLTVRGRARDVEVKLDAPKRQAPARIVLHLPKSRPAGSKVKMMDVQYRPDQMQHWNFQTVVQLFERDYVPKPRVIDGLVKLPLPAQPEIGQCRFLDLAPFANTDPFEAPFGTRRPGKNVFTGLTPGVQRAAGIPFSLPDPAKNNGRALVVLQGGSGSSRFPTQVEIPMADQGRRLYFLGNVHGWAPDDAGADGSGALAVYEIVYADGQTQTVPLIAGQTTDDWVSVPGAGNVDVGLQGDPWHLNVLGVTLRPAAISKIIFRDLGTTAAPLLLAITLEK